MFIFYILFILYHIYVFVNVLLRIKRIVTFHSDSNYVNVFRRWTVNSHAVAIYGVPSVYHAIPCSVYLVIRTNETSFLVKSQNGYILREECNGTSKTCQGKLVPLNEALPALRSKIMTHCGIVYKKNGHCALRE